MTRARLRVASTALAAVSLAVTLGASPARSADASSRAAGVSQPSITLSTSSAGATAVTWSATFAVSASGGLTGAAGTITLTAPTGTKFAGDSGQVFDATTMSGTGATSAPLSATGSNTETYRVGPSVQAGDAITIVVPDLTNPTALSTTDTLSVSTSADTTPVASAPFSITAPGSPGAVRAALSSAAAGATQITCSVSFGLSATGGLVGGLGKVTVAAPSGTVFTTAGATLYDLNTRSGTSSMGGPVSGAGTNVATYRVGASVSSGDSVSLVIPQVTNPAAGSNTLSVSTSSDSVAASSSTYATTAPLAVTALGVSRSSQVTGATGVTYSAAFAVSATGGLVGGSGTVTLAAPAGTVFTTAGASLYDVTTRSGSGSVGGPISGAGTNVATYRVVANLSPGDTVTLVIPQVTNSGTSGGTLAASTSSDLAGTVAITQAWAPAQPLVSLSSHAVNANHVQMAVTFVASGSAPLVAGTGWITLSAPGGTVFSDLPAHLVDSTTASGTNDAALVSGAGTDTATYQVRSTVNASDTVTLIEDDVTNPPTTATVKLSLTTSSGVTSQTSRSFTVVKGGARTAPVVHLSTAAVRAGHVSASISFTLSSTGALRGGLGTFTITGRAGTVFKNLPVHLVDTTTPSGTADSTLVSPAYSSTATYRVSRDVAAGDAVTVIVDDLPNPPTVSAANTMSVSTSSDTAAVSSAAYSTVARQSLAQLGLSIDRSAAGESEATYLLSATTSSTGGLAGGHGTITVNGAPGTVFFSSNATVYVPAARSTASAAYLAGAGSRTVTFLFPNDIGAGTRFLLAIPLVTNAPAATTSAVLTAGTSSDMPTASVTYTITAKPQLSVTYYVTERSNHAVARVELDANGGLYQDDRYFVTGLPGGGPDSAVFDHAGDLLVSNPDVGTITSLKATTGAVINPQVNATLLTTVADMALDPQSNTLWAIEYNASGASAIASVALSDGTTTSSNPSSISGLGGIIFNGSGSRLFVTSHSGAVDEISRTDGHLIRSLAVSGPDGMTFDPASGHLFMSGCGGLCEVAIGTDSSPTLTLFKSYTGFASDGITADGKGDIGGATGTCCLSLIKLSTGVVTTISSNIPSADDVAPLVGNGAPPLAISTTALPNATASTPYSGQVIASGGTTPYSWSVSAGALPSGFSINGATGAITGTTSSTGTFSFAVKVTDASPTVQTATRPLSITVNP